MRAVKELQAYLAAHPEPDERAVDLLGSALQLAAKNTRVAGSLFYKGKCDTGE